MISFASDPAPAIVGMEALAAAVTTAVEVGVTAAAEEAATAIRTASESGRPGPIGRSHGNRDSVEAHPAVPLGPGIAEAEAGPTSAYGRHLELGGPHWKPGVKYPFVEPGVTGALSEIEAAIIDAVNAALGGM